MNAIEIKDLTRDYGGGKGIFNLTFSVAQGEVFGFLGPNGAGKTTAIRHLMGFLKAESGSCTINGMDCMTDSAKIQKTLGYIPGEIAFMDEMTGNEFIKFAADYRGMKDLTRAKRIADMFELDASGKLRKMSKGMKQKVGIVCAFMHDPEVLVLDEPTSGLDPLMQNRFIELILEEKKNGKTILMSSHIFEEVERTCARVGIIRQGRLAAVDTIEALKRSKTKRYLITFDSATAADEFLREPFDAVKSGGHSALVSIKGNIRELVAAINKYPVTALDSVDQSLEEVFMQYYGGEAK